MEVISLKKLFLTPINAKNPKNKTIKINTLYKKVAKSQFGKYKSTIRFSTSSPINIEKTAIEIKQIKVITRIKVCITEYLDKKKDQVKLGLFIFLKKN